MPVYGLIDTGAIVALVDADDAWHERCRATLRTLRLPLATTAAVLAEVFHLLDHQPLEVEAVWRLLRSGAVTLLPITDVDMAALARLMQQYHDRPMDFADATLVRLAERESLSMVFTIDHNDFETYRIGGRGRFRIVPSR
jgi:predicted nucleic acid-binding protein